MKKCGVIASLFIGFALLLLFVCQPIAQGQTHITSTGGGNGGASSFGAQLANCILAGPTSGAAAIPTCRPMVALDLGTGLSPTFNAVTATSFIGALTGNATNITGIVAPLHGGTGQNFSSLSGFLHFNSGTGSLVALTETDVTGLTTDLAATEKSANKDQANGYAGLDSNGKLLSSAIPAIAITDTYVVGSQAAMLALSDAGTGDVAIRTDTNQTYILRGTTFSVLSDWSLLATPTDLVTSVAGRTGVVTLSVADVSGAETIANKDTANGYAGLTGAGKVLGTEIIYGSSASTVAQGNDSRLSDSRTPIAHAASHASAGSDPLTLGESQVTSLVSDLAGKQATGNYIAGLSGDGTATGPGTVALTLTTVNGSPGVFGSSTLIPTVTVNAKGLVTSITTNGLGNAPTATALTANGTNCSAGNYALGVDASGNAEGCTAISSGITNGAGNNVIPKSNGTNLVASSLSDDGSTVSTAENSKANSHIDGYTTTATAAATTALTVASTKLQFFTGSTTQTVVLPVASTLVTGQEFQIVNLSTGTVTVNSSGANLVLSMPANAIATIKCILTSGTTANSWSAIPIARTDVGQTFNGTQTISAIAGGVSNTIIFSTAGSTQLTLGGGAVFPVAVFFNISGNALVTRANSVYSFSNSNGDTNTVDTGISRDSASGDVAIGTGAAGSTVGRVRTSAVTLNINATAKTANYTTVATDYTILANTSGGAFTITLSSANAKTGQIYNIKMTATSANTLTLSPSSGNIDGSASTTITPTALKEGAMVQFDGTNWWIVGTYSGVL